MKIIVFGFCPRKCFWKIFQTNIVALIKIHILCLINFFDSTNSFRKIRWKSLWESVRKSNPYCTEMCYTSSNVSLIFSETIKRRKKCTWQKIFIISRWGLHMILYSLYGEGAPYLKVLNEIKQAYGRTSG